MGRARKQQHGKPMAQGKGNAASSDSGMTRQAAGSERHQEHLRLMVEAAKSRRMAKGRGAGKRYCYNGIKGKHPSVQIPLAVLSGKDYREALEKLV